MSMRTLTILQFTEIFSAYILMTVIVPFLVLRGKISHRRLTEQFLCSYMVGNCYIMNLVFVLEFMKISNGVTLAVATLVPALVIWIKIRDIHVWKILRGAAKTGRLLLDGHMGVKTLRARIFEFLGGRVRAVFNFCFRVFYRHFIEWILFGGILCALGWFYGSFLLENYGYSASDTPVHLWWINGLSDDHQIFVDGVYPFGFHCVIYYFHSVFHIDSYVFMRVFGFVQTIMVHVVLLIFLRLCCKSKYIGFAATGLYALGSFLQPSTYLRFFAVLPQEYGIIFILPGIYFAFQFFKEKEKELKKGMKSGESRRQLFYFAISFSMTLAVHFYGTMAAGLYCMGIAGGYIFWFIRRKYFIPVLVAGVASVSLAVAPLVFAFITGTPLQGSLGWGMSVINGTEDEFFGNTDSDEDEVENDTRVIVDSDGNVINFFDSSGKTIPVSKLTDEQLDSLEEIGAQIKEASEVEDFSSSLSGSAVSKSPVSAGGISEDELQELLKTAHHKSIGERVFDLWNLFRDTVKGAILSEPQKAWYPLVILGGIGALYGFGIFYFIFPRKRQYAAMLLSTGLFMTLMLCLQAADSLGLPSLMDSARCRIYFSYMVPVVLAMAVDAVITLVTWPIEPKKKKQVARRVICGLARGIMSLGCVAVVVFLLSQEKYRKERVESEMLVTNEAITCLTNIIHSEKDQTWTICSANDELQMGIDHGYHYELISFLRGMEYNNMEEDAELKIQIPTESVFFFIEKVPLNYTITYENSGQMISEKGASYPIPNVGGIGAYMGENRWIVMSKMYQWAKAFQKKYPNEMKVYLETDKFVCYKVEQNTYRLFNFAIDYDYNTRRWGKEGNE